MDENNPKLLKLAEIEGYDDVMELLQANVTDSICPGICMNDQCDYSTDVEPDQDKGWCEICNTNTVKSAMMIAEII